MKVTATQYAKALLELTDGKSEQEISAVVVKFAQQLKKDGQLRNFQKISEKFAELYNAKNSIVEASVTSRQHLDLRAVEMVHEFLQKRYDAREVRIENLVDVKIKGGIVIRIGDEVLDGTVDAQLKKLKMKLIG